MTARRVPVVSTFAYTLLVRLPPGLVMPNRFCSTFHGTSSSFGNSSVGSFCASRTMGTMPQLGKGVSWFSWEMLLVATNAWKEEEEGDRGERAQSELFDPYSLEDGDIMRVL